MSDFWKIIKRLRGYGKNLTLVVFFNIVYSLLTIISIPVLIPFFRLLFNLETSSTPSSNKLLQLLDERLTFIIDYSGREGALLQVCLTIVVIFFLKNLARYLASYYIVPVRVGFVTDLRRELYAKYLSIPYEHFPSLKTGDLISRMTADIQEIESSILRVIEVVFKSPIIIIGSIAFLVYTSPQLTLFVIILLVFTVFIIGGISKTLKKKSGTAQSLLGSMTNQVEESISSIKVIKAYRAEQNNITKFKKLTGDFENAMNSLLRRNSLSSPLSEFLGISVVMALMYYGAHLVFDSKLSPDTFFAFIAAFYQVIEPSKSLSSAYYSIQKGMAAYDRVNNHLSMTGENTKDEIKPLQLDKAIELIDVSHSYGNGTEVLKSINLTIQKGEMVAIVGPSGSGKTTLVDLIVGLLPIQQGIIALDGKNKTDFNISEWRSLFSIVTQSPILFHDTIYDNIALGKKSTLEEVKEACAIANANEFIDQLPKKYFTQVGEKGMKLSGGQRQRVTIARAILSNHDILILDEATSALDSESEKLVQDALEKITKQKTSIVIAHRLSTIKNASKIVVLKDGHILDIGTHNELLSRCKLYENMVARQSFDTDQK